MPRMISVVSSNLVAVGYEADTQKLYIQFRNGLYVYTNVPQAVYEGLMSASSHGKFFHQFIRNAYPYRRIG